MKRDILLGLMLGLASPALAGQIQQGPADIGVDAPELAPLGKDGVGFRSVTFVHKAQPDLEHPDPKSGGVALHDRSLKVSEPFRPASLAPNARRAANLAAASGADQPSRPARK